MVWKVRGGFLRGELKRDLGIWIGPGRFGLRVVLGGGITG